MLTFHVSPYAVRHTIERHSALLTLSSLHLNQTVSREYGARRVINVTMQLQSGKTSEYYVMSRYHVIWSNTTLYSTQCPVVRSMGRLLVLVPDELERKFRFAIVSLNVSGGKKGGLSAAVGEAIEDWLKKHERAIARGGVNLA